MRPYELASVLARYEGAVGEGDAMSATLEECAQACLSDDACISFTRETVGTGPGPCTRSISCTHAVAKMEAEIYLTQRGMAVSDAPFPGKSLYEKGSVRAGPMPLTYYADRLALAANYPTKIITEKKYVTAPISQGLSAATADPEPISSTKSAEYLAAEHPPYCVTVVLNRYNAADGLTRPSKGTTTLKVYGTTGNSMVTRGIPSPRRATALRRPSKRERRRSGRSSWRHRSVTGAMSRGIPYASSMTEEPTTSTSSWFHPLERKGSAPPSTTFRDISRSDTKVAERRMATATASLPKPAPCGPTPLWHLSSSAVYVQATTMVATTAELSERGPYRQSSSARAPRRTRPFSEKRRSE